MTTTPPISEVVEQVFQRLDAGDRNRLLKLRALIFEVARGDTRIGPLEEVLRWGEPAYITTKNKTGSTIRLSVEKRSGEPALFFYCQTTLVETFRTQFGDTLQYSKNRAVLLDDAAMTQTDALKICIASALSYYLKE